MTALEKVNNKNIEKRNRLKVEYKSPQNNFNIQFPPQREAPELSRCEMVPGIIILPRTPKPNSNERAFANGPRYFEPWSSDEDDTFAGNPSPNFRTTPMGGRLSLDIFNVHPPPLHNESSAVLGSNSCYTSHESITLTTRLPRSPT
ncbi:hypothetical protein TNCV_4469191 [Trichonephila clavipes]|nr:hypothetical protein TNCV_4469191 [Trichonephila clavipes]